MTLKTAREKPSIAEWIRGLTIGAIVIAGMIVSLFVLFMLANQPDSLLPQKCVFPTGIYCEDYMVEMNRTRLIIQNGIGKDLIVKKAVVTEKSASPLYLCEMTSGEIIIPNGESVTITADNCTIRDILSGHKYRYDLNFTTQYVGSEKEHTIQGDLFAGTGVSGETPPPRLPRGTILTGLVPLAYLLTIGWLWRQVMKDKPKRERLICLGIGLICSPAVIALIIAGFMLLGLLGGDVGIAPRLGAAIGIVALVILYRHAPRLPNWNQKRREFIRGVGAYALVLGLLHFFALFVWYFLIL